MSVAIPIPLLQHLPDVNVTPAVGVDEYLLTYDHDTGKFVLRAPVAAPDLSGYALLAGRAGGQTLYGGTAANDDITIHGTSDGTRATSYVLLQPTAGKVGIGTTTPTQLLTVAGAVSRGVSNQSLAIYGGNDYTDSGYFQVYGLTGGSTADQRGGAEFVIRNTATFKIISYDGSVWTDKFTIRGTGLVGIGTASPATALHVVGAATVTGGIRPAADSTTALQLQNAAGTSILNVDTTNARVGIGTTAPGAKLNVAGTSLLGGATALTIAWDGYDPVGHGVLEINKGIAATADGTNTAHLFFTSSQSNLNSAIGGFQFVNSAIAGTEKRLAAIGCGTTDATNSGFLSFSVTNAGVLGRVITILNTGRVGIGTTSPATRLDIDAGALTMAEMTAPTGVADKAMLYTKDNGSGKTQLCCKLGDDVEIVIATQA